MPKWRFFKGGVWVQGLTFSRFKSESYRIHFDRTPSLRRWLTSKHNRFAVNTDCANPCNTSHPRISFRQDCYSWALDLKHSIPLSLA